MGAGGGDRQRLDRRRVPAHVAADRAAARARRCVRASARRRRGLAAQRRRRAAPRCAMPSTSTPSTSAASRGALERHDEPVEPEPPRALGRGERPRAGAHLAAERQLAEDRQRSSARRRDRALGGEDRAGDREVEAGARLAQVRGREVDRDPPLRELEARVEDRRLDALARLGHGAIAEPDDGEGRQPAAQVGLDDDRPGVESVEREGRDAGEHGGEARRARVTAQRADCSARRGAAATPWPRPQARPRRRRAEARRLRAAPSQAPLLAVAADDPRSPPGARPRAASSSPSSTSAGSASRS